MLTIMSETNVLNKLQAKSFLKFPFILRISTRYAPFVQPTPRSFFKFCLAGWATVTKKCSKKVVVLGKQTDNSLNLREHTASLNKPQHYILLLRNFIYFTQHKTLKPNSLFHS